jgi:peptidoglycan/xylan/chitin deacetylase (PgdA/CDA1 family)
MLRLDRIISLYLSLPLARLLGRDKMDCVPILAYHSVSDNLFGYSHPYYQINTTPEIFRQQMCWLRRAGYQTMDLRDLPRYSAPGDDSKKIILTFDDGYRDFLTEAWPVLQQRGFSATIFLVTDRIQNQAQRIEGAEYLTWQEVRELHSQGVCFGSQTASHPDLRSLGPEQIEYELGFSKELIEQQLGAPVGSFSYPFPFPEEDGHFVRYLVDVLENQGYQNAVSTVIGRATCERNGFFLPRLPVNSWDDPQFLQAKLQGGYDWLHWPQWIYKFVNHNVPVMQRAGWAEAGKTRQP